MTIHQISVFLENRAGQLAEITSVLARHNIDLRAINIAETTDYGVLRLIADKPQEAASVLLEQGFILSMTPEERENPSLLNSSRKKRIAAGSGTQVVDVNRLLKQFEMLQTMTRQFSGGKLPRNMRKLMGKKGGMMPGMGGRLPF